MDASKQFVPYLNVTTMVPSTPDQELLAAKGANAFPTLLFMEPESGAVLGPTWWPSDEETVREELAKATAKADALKQLKRDAEARPDDKAVQATLKLKLALMYAGETPLAELAELARTEGLDPALKAEFEPWYAGKRVMQAVQVAQAKAQSRAEQSDLIEVSFYELLKEGVRLPPEHEAAEFYYDFGLNGAVKKGDRAVAQAAYEGYEKVLQGAAARSPQFEAEIKKALEEAKARLKRLDEPKEE